MGFVGNLLGGSSGNTGGAGINYEAGQAKLITPDKLQSRYNEGYLESNQALQQQLDFVNALRAQGGLQNQSNTFNQLQNVALGQGPNPAQAQLAQATGANVANQAALMASQRGASANAGMIARQAAQAGGNLQQQAVGQAATLQAQQSLGALGQMGQLSTNQVQQQAANQNAYAANQMSQQQMMLNAINSINQARVGNTSSANAANSGVASGVAQQQGQLLGQLVGAAGSAMGGMAHGGMVEQPQRYAFAGMVGEPAIMATAENTLAQPPMPELSTVDNANIAAPKSSLGKFFEGYNKYQQNLNNPNQLQGTALAGKTIGTAMGKGLKSMFAQGPSNTGGGVSGAGGMAASMPTTALNKGGSVPALVSPGEQYLPPKDVEKAKEGKNPLALGERIPGKPKVKGDNLINDTVPKTLKEGGIVIPNSIMQSKNPEKKAMEFVRAVLAKQRK